MNRQLLICAVLTGLSAAAPDAIAAPLFPFSDGRWHGEIRTGQNGSDPEECLAEATYDDGTILTLAEQSDGRWDLGLSNPALGLEQGGSYVMDVLIDAFPRLQLAAEARDPTHVEVADIGRSALFRYIENGHTFDVRMDGLSAKYDLEGSAKAIQRIRSCFADEAVGAGSAKTDGSED